METKYLMKSEMTPMAESS